MEIIVTQEEFNIGLPDEIKKLFINYDDFKISITLKFNSETRFSNKITYRYLGIDYNHFGGTDNLVSYMEKPSYETMIKALRIALKSDF